MVAGPAAEDGPGESEDAQLGDLETVGGGVEALDGDGETALYRRGETAAGPPHEGASRLQVPVVYLICDHFSNAVTWQAGI